MTRQNLHDVLSRRLREKRRFLQVLAGPRQAGKTTLARQVMAELKVPAHYASADEPTLRDRTWLEQQWDGARLKAKAGKAGALKMLGQLHDAGNTVTLAHYLQLLHGAGMVAGLSKYAHGQVRQRGSSPKLQVLNTALMTAQAGRSFEETRHDGDYWGRLVESCVGAHLLNTSMSSGIEVTYWRDRNQEVDFVLHRGKTTVSIEVKSGRRKGSLAGMEAFAKQFRPKRQLLVGGQGIPLEEFLVQPAGYWLQ